MPTVTILAHADAYIDQANPDTNHGTETLLRVRTELDANRRALILFDMDQVPDDFVEWRDPVSIYVQIVNADNPTFENRRIDLEDLAETFDEATLTWNNQPGLGVGLIEYDDVNGAQLHFDLLGVLSAVPLSGPWPLRLRDHQEDDDSLEGPFEQELAAREHTTVEQAKFQALYQAQGSEDLGTSVTVRETGVSDLLADILPRVQAETDLGAVLDVVYTRELVATVAPTLTERRARGRLGGFIARLFLEPLDDVRRISDEAGSLVTRVQDGETNEMRRIVQVIAAGAPNVSLPETPTFPGTDTGAPDTLRRGDAILFAVGDERWAPGAVVTWEGHDYEVVGVLGVERVEDEVLYQEVGLRRLSVTSQGRVEGVIV